MRLIAFPALVASVVLGACAKAPAPTAVGAATLHARAKGDWLASQLPAGFQAGVGIGVGNRLVVLDAASSAARLMALPSTWSNLAAPPAGLTDPMLTVTPAFRVLAISSAEGGQVARLDIEAGTWESLPRLEAPRTGAALGSYGHFAYVAGGGPEGGASRRVDVLDQTKRQWLAGPLLPEARGGAVLERVGARMLLAGGHAGSGVVDGRCWLLDPATGAWTQTSPMPTPRSRAAVVSYGQFLFVVGGLASSGPSAAIERFDLGTRSWSRLSPLPEARTAPVASRIGERVVVLGGQDAAGRPAGTVWTAPVTAFLP